MSIFQHKTPHEYRPFTAKTPTTRTAALARIGVLMVAASFLFAACGEDEEYEQPEFEDLQIHCGEESENQGVRGPIVKEVRVKVSDPNRNLVSVTGTLNGITMNLEDPEADFYFSWFPAEDAFPIVCSGEFTVDLKATDADGNTTLYSEIITK